MASKRIYYLWINLTKELKDLYTENYKRVMKEIEDTNKWKDILCSWIVRINLLKYPYYAIDAIPIKIPMLFFTEIEWSNCKICMESQMTLNSQSNRKKDDQSQRYHTSWFQTIFQSRGN